MNERPVIGVCANLVRAKWTVWDQPATLIMHSAIEQLAAAGCVPVVLPALAGSGEVLGRLDGLLLPGGGDLDPALYGAAKHPATGRLSPSRDAAETALARAAIAIGLPVLGICRGLQILNTVLGGTLHQHLPDITGHSGHGPEPGVFGKQRVRLERGSRIAAILGGAANGAGDTAEASNGGDAVTVPCHHHQAIDRVGDGLVVTARADDGIIEAVELADHPFAVAVQWHAEEDGGGADRLFRAFFDAARTVRV